MRNPFVAMTLCGCTALACANTIDFEDVPGNSVTDWNGAFYASQGVLFSTPPGDSLRSSTSTTGVPSGDRFIFAADATGFAGGTVEATFTDGVQAVGASQVSFYVFDGTDARGTWTASFYDINDALLTTISGNGSFISGGGLVTYSTTGFDIYRVSFTPSWENEGIDDFSFTLQGNVIPTPAAALLGAPCFAVMLRRRR